MEILSVIVIILTSTFKYFFGIILAMQSSIGFFPSFLTNFGGGFIGLVACIYFGSHIRNFVLKYFSKKDPKVFSKMNRLIVRLKSGYGLPGVAFLTPILLSIPVGVFISLTMTGNRKQILLYMSIACLFWSAVILLPYYMFDINLGDLIMGIFK